MIHEKYALLDTDFISKMHLIRKDDENHLIDRIMEMPNYYFFCHAQVKTELLRHNIAGAPQWLECSLSEGRIVCYNDKEIIDELSEIYGNSATAMYVQLLRTSCEAYRVGYFEEKFAALQQLDYIRISKEEFLAELVKSCDLIGEGQNLGELKTYVLLQMLHLKYGEKIYVFCSDDRNARNGIVSIGGARCISVLSSFLRLQKECGFTKEEAEPYIQSFLGFCANSNQTAFRILESARGKRFCKVPCAQVLAEIFEGKLEELQTGNLRYL